MNFLISLGDIVNCPTDYPPSPPTPSCSCLYITQAPPTLPPSQEFRGTDTACCLTSQSTFPVSPSSLGPSNADPAVNTALGLVPRAWPAVLLLWHKYDCRVAVRGTPVARHPHPSCSREFQAEQHFYYHFVIGVSQAWDYC